MDDANSSDKSRTVQLSGGQTIILHFAQDKPSLQELMVRIISKHQYNSAKI